MPSDWLKDPPRMPGIGVRIDSTMGPSDALVRLRGAVTERRYSVAGRESVGFFRLDCDVSDEAELVITGRPYVIPGVPAGSDAMTMRFRGHLEPAGNAGCVLVGEIDAIHTYGPGWANELVDMVIPRMHQMSADSVGDFARYLRSLITIKPPPTPISEVRLDPDRTSD